MNGLFIKYKLAFFFFKFHSVEASQIYTEKLIWALTKGWLQLYYVRDLGIENNNPTKKRKMLCMTKLFNLYQVFTEIYSEK